VEVPEWLERFSNAVDRALERADARPPQQLRSGTRPDAVPWVAMPWDTLHEALAR
jgi:hypothetical protein